MATEVRTPVLLSVRETAKLLGLSERQVWRKLSRGEIPAVQLGGPGTAVRIDRDELVAWLRSSPEGDAAA
jgi:excisionase family DNA binding protein